MFKGWAGVIAGIALAAAVMPSHAESDGGSIVISGGRANASGAGVGAMPPIPSRQHAGAASATGATANEPPGEEKPEVVPVVEYDVSKLPEPVKRMREQIIAAAATGEPEQMKPVLDANGGLPDFGSSDAIEDPIAYLKSLSGDPEGREILAILIEVLDAGYVHADAGTPDEMYVWPYFARYPVDQLTPPQLVELFKLIYAGDWEDMRNEGAYLFYKVGISPGGKWEYFTAGD